MERKKTGFFNYLSPYYCIRRKLEQSTQTSTINLASSPKLDSAVQVWVVKEDTKGKMALSEDLVNRPVQSINPSIPGRIIILMILLATLCAAASYMTKSNVYNPAPSIPGHIKNLRDTFVELTWAIVNPFISLLQSKH